MADETSNTTIELEENDEYMNNVDYFYDLKEQYETYINEENAKILNGDIPTETKTELIKKQKQKYKCINCSKEGGTIFLITKDTLKAYCGSNEPCSLDINIKKKKITNIYNEYKDYNKRLKDTKNEIMRLNLDNRFKFINEDETLEIFELLQDDLKLDERNVRLTTDIYYSIVNNIEKNNEIKREQEKFKNILINMREITDNYKKEKNIEYLNEFNELYIKELLPLTDKLREMNYKLVEVICNDSKKFEIPCDYGMYKLIEKTYTIADLHIEDDNDDNDE